MQFCRKFLLLLGLPAILFLAACSQQQGPPDATQIQNMLTELVDISQPDDQRQAADAQLVQSIGADSTKRLAALVEIVEGYGQHPAMKIYALDQIRSANPELAEAVLAANIPRFDDWDVLTHACAMAQELQDKNLIGPLVESLARPAVTYSLPRWPEAHVIETLSGQKLTVELAYLLLDGGEEKIRLDALQVLYDLQGNNWLKQFILTAAATDPLIDDLQWFIRNFNFVPRDGTEVLWIQELHEPRMAAMANAAHQHVSWIAPADVPDGIEPRFIYLLAFLNRPSDYPSRDTLLGQVAALLAERRHRRRVPSYSGAPDDIDPTLQANQNRLVYCDLLLIKTLLQAIAEPENCRSIYTLGYNSMSNVASETGGLLAFDPASTTDFPVLTLNEYPSELNIGAGIYVGGKQLMLDTPNAAAQFIFHFQNVDNSQYVGPAAGDVAYVKNTRCNVVIFTSVGDHIFDAMVDFPSGAVIDLGVFNSSD